MIKIAKIIAVTSALGLSGCFNVLPEPDPANSIYRLTSNIQKAGFNVRAPIVRIETPSADRLVATRRIVVSPDANRMAVAGGAEWADSLPKLVQKSMLDILASKPEVTGIIPRVGAKADYRVHINIDNFEARFDNGSEAAPMIIVAYTASFAKSGSRDLLGTKQFTTTQRSSGINVSQIVSAMNAANNDTLSKMSDWITSFSLTKS